MDGPYEQILDAMHQVVRELGGRLDTDAPPSSQKARADVQQKAADLIAEMEALKKSDPKAAAAREEELRKSFEALKDLATGAKDAMKASTGDAAKMLQDLKDLAAKQKE